MLCLNEAWELFRLFPIHAPISRNNQEFFLFAPPQAGPSWRRLLTSPGEVILGVVIRLFS